MKVERVYVNVWKPVAATHACAGAGRTMCGLDIPRDWEEGGDFEADEAETYVSCGKCLRAVAKREREAEQGRDR